ncbi:hypothetical protein J3R82DRAFT_2106, partial [Butyriboletus roseoflavus]
FQNHPSVPVDRYPGIPRHLIEHHDVQRMHCLCSPPPPSMFPSNFQPLPPLPHFNHPIPPPMFSPAPSPDIPLIYQ